MASQRPKKEKVVAFKVEEELAILLDKLPNKSAFIRKAIEAQLGRPCPLCTGKGIVPRGVYEHYAPLIEKHNSRSCDHCGDELSLPKDAAELEAEAKTRLEQFFHGGPLYCAGCFDEAPACTDCGDHVHAEHVADHMRQAHRD